MMRGARCGAPSLISDRRERRKRIEIHDVRAWYNSDSIINGEEIVTGYWPAKSRRAPMAIL
jgi:hypothetical protein